MQAANGISGAIFLSAACLLGGCNQGATVSAPSGSSAAAAAKLGDLAPFKSIAVDTAALVNKGDFEAAKTRIKDLEIRWDEAEAGLKPRAADDWHSVDKAIDGALKAVRATPVNAEDAKRELAAAIAAMDRTSGK